MPVLKRSQLTRRAETQRPERLRRTLGILDFYNKRNKVLIIRGVGGLGDIFMHRMMFEDFKLLMPDAELHFACPRMYHEVLEDHPFLDKVLDSATVDKSDYIISYNTTTACGRTEMKLAPYHGPHRSDIWANHCGLQLTRHDMHIQITPEEQSEAKSTLETVRDQIGPIVVICPISAMENKNLNETQATELIQGLRERGFCPVTLHNTPVHYLIKHDVPMIHGVRLRKWMAVLNQADYVISVDTAAFHCAGGMKKPTVGVFTFVASQVYSKYYPNTELVQGACPFLTPGCYNWGQCPDLNKKPSLPCKKSITSNQILSAFDHLTDRFPIGLN